MEDRCFQEGCWEETFLLCKCTDPPTGVCESHFSEHIRTNFFGKHDTVFLKTYVDPEDSQKVIKALENQKESVYENMKHLEEVTKKLHLCIEAEFKKESNQLKLRENEIQKLIDRITGLKEFKISQSDSVLPELFSGDNFRRSKCLQNYVRLSMTFDTSSLKKNCEKIFSEYEHLNYSGELSEDEIYWFSDTSTSLITYNLSTKQKSERHFQGELLGASMECVLPDGRLFCRNKQRLQHYFIVDICNGRVIPLEEPTRKTGNQIETLPDDDVVHIVDISNQSQLTYMHFDLKTMQWDSSPNKKLNLEGLTARSLSLVKREGKIYAISDNYNGVWMYYKERGQFIQIFGVILPQNHYPVANKALFGHGNRLFFFCETNNNNQYRGVVQSTNALYCMEAGSNEFTQVKLYDYNPNFNTSSYVYKTRNSVYFWQNNQSVTKFDPKTYEVTQIKLK